MGDPGVVVVPAVPLAQRLPLLRGSRASSEGSALMKLRQPSSVVAGARRFSSRPTSATTISRPPCGRRTTAAGSPAPAWSRSRPPARPGHRPARRSPHRHRPGGATAGAAVAAVRPATRRERAERVRPAAWSCCGDAGPPGPGSGPCPARSSRSAAAAAISASVAGSLPRAASICRAWFQACSPNGTGAGAQVFPGRGQPAAVVVVADPDPGDVVGVVADLPPAVFRLDPGMLAPVGVQLAAVVGPQADLDAVGVDHPPGGREQLDVILRAERDRDIAGHVDQGGVPLVGGQRAARGQRVAQPVMRAVLPDRFTDRTSECPCRSPEPGCRAS